MNKTKLSIIVPHYNSLSLLKKLIESIPKREEIQVIVVDDNSTEEIDDYKLFQQINPHIVFLLNSTGKNSAGRCRNIGLEVANGEWVLFADADDFFVENMWDKVTPYLEQKECDIVYFTPTSCMLCGGGEGTRHLRSAKMISEYLKEPDFYHKTRLKYWYESPCSKLIRRSIIEQNGIVFDTTKVANDVMFSMRVAVAVRDITASQETIYCITQSQGTLTTSLGRENFEGRFEVFLRKYRFLKENLTPKEWRVVALVGEPYLKLAKRNGIEDAEIKEIKRTLRKEGVRIKAPGKWSVGSITRKIRSFFNL